MSATIGTKLQTFFYGMEVGKDEFGNRYYHQRRAPKTGRRRRWVVYAGIAEPSKVPPHWHAWLHYTVDKAPIEGAKTAEHDWQKPHQPNATGTSHRYLPEGHLLQGGERARSAADYVAWKP